MMRACPCCTSLSTELVVLTRPVPVNPCILVRSAEVSCNAIRRPIELQGCRECGFLWNASFDETLVTYDQTYEGTQSCSAHFQGYLNRTAIEWGDELGPGTGSILEVGCGQGEFLDELATTTTARLLGYDPAFRQGDLLRATVIPTRLPALANQTFDAVVNRMTLEHIADPFAFVSAAAGWVSDAGCLVTQVPNAGRMVTQSLYCDLIYEHVNYFNAHALTRLFERAGFKGNRCHYSYDNQHLTVFSRRAPQDTASPEAIPSDEFRKFSATIAAFSERWSDRLAGFASAGNEVFIWGAGSRATTFLNALSDPGVVTGAIDINPRRTGTFVQGTACETCAPDILRHRSKVKIVVMNPIYCDEIYRQLQDLSVTAELVI